MEIAVYSCRPDEIQAMDKFEKEYGVSLRRTEEPLNEKTVSMARGCQAISIITTQVTAPLLDVLHTAGIAYISTRTIGYDHIDVSYAKKLGMHVGNVSYSPNSVADYAVMLILMSTRRMKSIWRHALVQNYSLDGVQGRELPNLTVGVVGTGHIGRAVIRRLVGFGCRILATDLYENDEVKKAAQYVPLDTLLHESDVITLHMPATKNDYHIMNQKNLAKMKKDAVLVNTGRGSLIDSDALIDALEAGSIGGAALDVIENEAGLYYNDLQDQPLKNRDLALLKSFPNVIVTPHTAFYTDQAVSDMVENSIKSCIAYAKGEKNPWQVV
ncbi:MULTISPECIES: D-isomer specific 2-hydroxyacid dehydrogenase family protein [Caproicibacterium]|jgi:D-lactate dehydrogenase|uniref:Lactate dehydrogenase n=1 Tax=Caproicibacterium lactatifermentans TaxID=2666138 RepID=A0A859DPB4_9FIRM|nr:D-isomer specific 2-hydroxyacid dehydrogenase family protein [Caproicibacterium lactatifermentans]ARP50607.1 lactate dehydrogenase [Ruminococcaceae bacterium CPB6]MDD4808254.1 D-isomer specific 2-hydroxyacid dehydrogenase family protein [Oscillospiraceae bacterium]QKN23658.1 lactate dehydrogenase [Caproicibacterium lactatifermentans]